ncbi:MAG: YHS domain-containing (seleno)protein [Sulfitobacter sp.]
MPSYSRRSVLTFGLSLPLVTLFQPAKAGEPKVSTDKGGIAIRGYDTQAYWTIDAPRPGIAGHVVQWNGAIWRFASAEDAAKFAASPADFAPQFGGFCTRTMSLKKVVHGDPEVWRIFEDRLYLFAKPVGGKVFDKDEAAMIAAAQAHWDNLH